MTKKNKGGEVRVFNGQVHLTPNTINSELLIKKMVRLTVPYV